MTTDNYRPVVPPILVFALVIECCRSTGSFVFFCFNKAFQKYQKLRKFESDEHYTNVLSVAESNDDDFEVEIVSHLSLKPQALYRSVCITFFAKNEKEIRTRVSMIMLLLILYWLLTTIYLMVRKSIPHF